MSRITPVNSPRSIAVQNQNASAIVPNCPIPLPLDPPRRPSNCSATAPLRLSNRFKGLSASILVSMGSQRMSFLRQQLAAQRRLDAVKGSGHRLCQFMCSSAFQSLVPVLLNAAVSVAFSWLSAFCISQGNIFSSSAPSNQSHKTFLVGVLVWVHLWFCSAVVVARSTALFRLELISHPGRKSNAVRILGRMFRRTLFWFLFSGTVIAAIGFGFGSLDASYRKYRLELYTSALWNYSFVHVTNQAARRIYRYETVEGNRQQQLRLQQQRLHREVRKNRTRSPRRMLLSFLIKSFVLMSLFVPTLYVHALSFAGAITSSQVVWLFTLASLVLKVLMQEAAKAYILHSKIQSPRTMATVVAVPTVLIDTQVRIVLLRFQDVQVAMSTTVAIAFAEVCVRVIKALIVNWHVQQRQQSITKPDVDKATTTTPSISAGSSSSTETKRIEPTHLTEFELWRAQLHRYHAIEVSADMYAEYLAIGCSSAIMFMFGQHPQFLLTASASTSASDSWTSLSTHLQLVAQVAMEVVVDLVSCAVEVSSGITFTHVNRERGYFLVLCVGLALINVNVSAILYLAYATT